MSEEKKRRRSMIRLRGLRQRWIFNTVMPVALVLMIGGIAAAKRGWEKDTGKKAVLFFDLSAKKDPTE